MESNDLCPLIKNILLLDSEGKRVAGKYYSDDWPTNSSKLAFEKFVFTKTVKTNARTEAEITLLENNIIVCKFVQDLHFFVTGDDDENDLILASVLQGFFDAVTLLLRSNVDKDAPLSEQTLTQAWATARDTFTRTLLTNFSHHSYLYTQFIHKETGH
ncbi:unnamed protein product [Vicia faba]|uniref:Coatomer subunit zeta n=1 Tax=Vicia faba TaxID=3906 RepID=A0AAV1B1C5_VICFA|nr:unnamed protein product [Vicia faba]